MQENPFDEIKKIMELREKGAISESEAAEMLSILEQQYKAESASEISEGKPKVFGDADEPGESKPRAGKIPEQKKKTNAQSGLNEEKPKTFFEDEEPLISSNLNVSKKGRSNNLVYIIAGFGLIFICSLPLFRRDSDGDGYRNYFEDNCPEVSGTIDGCPDSDGDGIIDKEDECPKLPGDLNGCPDQDGDGVADKNDNCDTIPGPIQNNGCPDQPKLDREQKTIHIPKNEIDVNKPNEHNKNESVKEKKETQTTNNTKTNPKTTSPTNVQTPPTNPPKPPQGKGLTQTEEKELNDLQVKEATSLLTSQERERKKMLERKKL